MQTLTRKLIEDYYYTEWSGKFSEETIRLLIELACKEYKIAKLDFLKPVVPAIKPLKLGDI